MTSGTFSLGSIGNLVEGMSMSHHPPIVNKFYAAGLRLIHMLPSSQAIFNFNILGTCVLC